jgi:predicted acyltransferase
MEPRDRPVERLLSLDVLRGLTVMAMMMVDWPGSWDTRFGIFEHAHWTGVTAADFIFPTFMVLMGVAVPFSLAGKRAAPPYGRIFRRAALLLAIGFVLNLVWSMPGPIDWSRVRIPGVLQRFGLVYPLAALAYLHLSPRRLAWLAAGILVGYALLMTLVPVPGYGHPDLGLYPTGETTPNLAAWLDRRLFGHHLYEYPFDPEGVLGTLPALASALIGTVAGCWLLSGAPRPERANRLLAWGVALAASGYLAGLAVPLCKKVWSSSFALLTGGWALLFLGALFWAVDIAGKRSRLLTAPRWYGANALAGIVVFTVIDCTMSSIPVGHRPDRSAYPLKDFLYDHLFRAWLPDRHASWVYSAVAIALLSLLFRALYRRRMFIRA